MIDIPTAARQARTAAHSLAVAAGDMKNAALAAIADALWQKRAAIEAANREDLQRSEAENLAAPLLKRLVFDEAKIADSVQGLRALIGLPEPVGRVLEETELDEGLMLSRITCPIGVIGVIFESRPDALVQISALCLKSGNAVLLKGGSEAARTNRILADIIAAATVAAGVAPGWIHLLETRDDVAEMLKLDDLIDLVIPRGSNEFVRYIMDTSRIPVMGHADGICHLYIDAAADAAMALEVTEDSKCQYVAVCNALETLLVHAAAAPVFLPRLHERLAQRGVELRGCERTRKLIPVAAATDADWSTEYLDLVLAIRVVDSLDEAVTHINRYGSGHTDGIVTGDAAAAEKFLNAVDSGSVFWNASTRFADGFRYGLGAEVGISTSKLHARGPVGLDGLLSYKWQLRGSGQTVAPYAGGQRKFTHRRIEKRG